MTTVKMTKTAERNVEITSAFSKGESKEALASRFGLTVRTIQRIVAGCVVVASVAATAPATAAAPAQYNDVWGTKIDITVDSNQHHIQNLMNTANTTTNGVSVNMGNIATNTGNIATNAANITSNTQQIKTIQGQVQTLQTTGVTQADIDSAVDAEKNRATKAEKANTDAITKAVTDQAKVDAKQDADTTAALATKADASALAGKADASALTTEVKRATDAEKVNADALTKAVTDQKAVDAAQDKLITDNTDASMKAAQAAFTVHDELTTETTERKDADTKLQGAIDQNTADIAKKADASALTSKADSADLAKEVKRATNAEKVNADAITKAVTDQKTTDQNQDKAIDSKASQADLTKETNARHADVNMLNTRLKDKLDVTTYGIDKGIQKTTDQKQDALIAGKATSADLQKEVTRATAAESKLTADKADKSDVTALQGQVNTKASQADLTKETNARHADINQMNTRLKDKLDVTTYGIDKGIQKTTDSAQNTLIAGKATQTDLTKEVTRATAAEAKLTADKADKSAVTTLQNQVNTKASSADVQAEVKRATTAEQAAQKTADNALNGLKSKADASTVTSEVTRAKAAEAANTKLIQGKANSADLTAEVSRAKAAEANKVEKSVFTADQARQDKLIASKADAADVTKVHNEADAAEHHAAQNSKLISNDEAQLKVVSGQVTTNSASIRAIGSQQKVQGDFIQKQQKTLNNHEQRLNTLEHADHKRNAQVDRNKRDIADTRETLKRGLNNAAAMSSLHFNGNADSWALSAGTANGDGAAFAGGIQKSITDHAAVTVQFSSSDNGDYMAGVGIHGDY